MEAPGLLSGFSVAVANSSSNHRSRPLCYADKVVNPRTSFKTMPKLKTHKGAAKRFKKTGTGKIKRHHAFARHILTSKSRSRKRRLGQSSIADPANSPEIKRMLPY